MFSTDSRSQVGVGTLVVYLTIIVLTAAAAGVLISTAASLQAQAHQPGSTAQSGDITATDAAGHVETLTTTYDSDRAAVRATDPFVTEIRVTVTGTPGEQPIDLTEATVVYNAGRDARFLVHESRADPAAINASTNTHDGKGNAAFLIEPVDAASPGNALLTAPDDTYQLVIPLGIAYAVDSASSPRMQTAANDWGDNPAAPASLSASALFTDADADDPAATPYTLRDVTAPPLPGAPVDQSASTTPISIRSPKTSGYR